MRAYVRDAGCVRPGVYTGWSYEVVVLKPVYIVGNHGGRELFLASNNDGMGFSIPGYLYNTAKNGFSRWLAEIGIFEIVRRDLLLILFPQNLNAKPR